MNPKYILLSSALIATALSALITIIPIGLYNQAQVSAELPTLFTPATLTFSIWSLIYLSWIAVGIYEAFGKSWISKENVYLLASAQILSSLWLIPSQNMWIGTSLIVMLGVLYLLSLNLSISKNENMYFRSVVELFFGWILVASIANIHLTLVAYNIYYIPEFLTYISIFGALLVNVFLIKKYSIYIPAIVLIWAALGIILAQEDITTQLISILSIITLLLVSFHNYFLERK